MQFNIKLKEYKETGTATITVYDDLVGAPDDIERKPKSTNKNVTLEWNPFTGEYEEVALSDEEIFEKEQENLQHSVARSKKKIMDLMRSKKWEYFCTFTFSKEKIDRYDFSLCTKKVRQWLHNQKRNTGAENLAFICIPEAHKDGAWHAHAVLADVGSMSFSDTGKITKKGQKIFNLGGWKWGFSTAIQIGNEADDNIKLSRYITKYLTKESFMLAKNRHRYFASTNIKPACETKWIYENEDEKNVILSSLIEEKGYNVIWSSRYEGQYVNADYYDLTKDD